MGHHFPTGETADILVNGILMGTIPVDNSGNLVFLLNTSGAEVGFYFITVEVNPCATVPFMLDAGAPLRAQEGSGTTFNVPSGIAFTEMVYLPMAIK